MDTLLRSLFLCTKYLWYLVVCEYLVTFLTWFFSNVIFNMFLHHWRKCNRDGWGDRPTSEGWEHFSRNNFDNGNYSVFNKSLIITNVKLSMIWQYACFHLIWSVWMIIGKPCLLEVLYTINCIFETDWPVGSKDDCIFMAM